MRLPSPADALSPPRRHPSDPSSPPRSAAAVGGGEQTRGKQRQSRPVGSRRAAPARQSPPPRLSSAAARGLARHWRWVLRLACSEAGRSSILPPPHHTLRLPLAPALHPTTVHGDPVRWGGAGTPGWRGGLCRLPGSPDLGAGTVSGSAAARTHFDDRPQFSIQGPDVGRVRRPSPPGRVRVKATAPGPRDER